LFHWSRAASTKRLGRSLALPEPIQLHFRGVASWQRGA
jgi:hypothetical protein